MIAPGTDAVVIVSGGSQGTGRDVVRLLARRGYAIVIVYLDDQAGAEAAVDEIFAADGTAVAVRADVTDDLDVERLFDETIAAFGSVDAVVHTTTHSTAVLSEHAGRHLQRGSALVGIETAEQITAAVAELVASLDRR